MRRGEEKEKEEEEEEEEEESEMKSPTLAAAAAALTFLLCSFVEIRRMKVVVFVSTTSLSLVRSDECIKR